MCEHKTVLPRENSTHPFQMTKLRYTGSTQQETVTEALTLKMRNSWNWTATLLSLRGVRSALTCMGG